MTQITFIQKNKQNKLTKSSKEVTGKKYSIRLKSYTRD